MGKQKNHTLELLKLFASYMVVFIHVIFSGYVGTAMETIARFAVPFFFVVSGFYSYEISPQKIKNRIKKTVVLIVFAVVSYTVFNTLLLLSNGDLDGVCSYFLRYIDLSNIVKLLFLNVPICLEYFWYLYAVLYVYVIFYFVTVFHVKDKVIFIISGSILLLHVLLGEALSVFGVALPGQIVRSFAVMGVSFFGLGLLVKKYQHKFLAIPNLVVFLSFIAGILESILSRYFFEKKEIYIGSLLILFALICVFIKYSTIKYPRFLIALGGCSTYIYVFHDMVSKSIRAVYAILGIDMNSSVILKNLHPIVVCVISTFVAFAVNKMLEILQRHKKSQDKIRLQKGQAE